MPCGTARCHTEGLFRVPQGNEQVLRIPVEGERQQARRVNKLVRTWTGPWRVAFAAGSQQLYGVEDIVTGERKAVHIARISSNTDDSLVVTACGRSSQP